MNDKQATELIDVLREIERGITAIAQKLDGILTVWGTQIHQDGPLAILDVANAGVVSQGRARSRRAAAEGMTPRDCAFRTASLSFHSQGC